MSTQIFTLLTLLSGSEFQFRIMGLYPALELIIEPPSYRSLSNQGLVALKDR